METQPHVRVGVGVMILKDGKVLLGQRKNAHGVGTWHFPGGHLEFGESFEECAKREVMEETGCTIKNVEKVCFTNDIFPLDNKHYVSCFVKAEIESGEVQNMEPEKLERWDWFEWDKFPEPLFIPLMNLRKEKMDVIV